MRLAFIDTETTGLDPEIAEVIEIAIIRVEPGHQPKHFHSRIKPERIEDAHPKALEINGYAADPHKWEHAPLMSEVGGLILSTLKGCTLVGHNVAFDEAMINANLKRSGFNKRIPYRKIDTQILAMEHLYPLGLKRAGMDAIRQFLSWDTEGSHTAMKDAKDARKLFELTWQMGLKRKMALKSLLVWRKFRKPMFKFSL